MADESSAVAAMAAEPVIVQPAPETAKSTAEPVSTVQPGTAQTVKIAEPVLTVQPGTAQTSETAKPLEAAKPVETVKPVEAVKPAEAVKPEEKKEASDAEKVKKIQEGLTKDLTEAAEFKGETPEAKGKRAYAEQSLAILDRVMYRLSDETKAGAKAAAEILDDLGKETKYLAEHARDAAKRQAYEAEAKLMAEWGKLLGQKKPEVTEVNAAAKPEVTANTAKVAPETPKMDIAAQIEAALNEAPGDVMPPQGPIVSTEPPAMTIPVTGQ